MCDAYLGIFAWRYGFVPPQQERSITELELRKAEEEKKVRLIFLLAEDAPWSKPLMDTGVEGGKIEELRKNLKNDYIVEFFRNKDELVSCISIAVANRLALTKQEDTNKASESKRESDNGNVKAVLGMIKPVILAFLAILFSSVLTMILCIAVPLIRDTDQLKLAFYGLGSINALLCVGVMWMVNQAVAIHRNI